jgi:hypothetical protein
VRATAVLAIDQIHSLLRSVSKRTLRTDNITDESGKLRVIFRTPNWEDFVNLACTEPRRYGADSIQVVRIESLIRTLPEDRHAALQTQLALLDHTIEAIYSLPEDLALARGNGFTGARRDTDLSGNVAGNKQLAQNLRPANWTRKPTKAHRKAFIRKGRLKHAAVAHSLEEVGDRLFTFTRLPPSRWRSAHHQRDRKATRGVQVPQSWMTAFSARLQELGWKEGENLRIDHRWGDGATPTSTLAKELVELWLGSVGLVARRRKRHERPKRASTWAARLKDDRPFQISENATTQVTAPPTSTMPPAIRSGRCGWSRT